MVRARKCSCKNWQIRNDSANVAASVNPKMGVFCHRRNCYCHEKHVPPRLFSRPKPCGDFDRHSVKQVPPFWNSEWRPKFRDIDTDSEEGEDVSRRAVKSEYIEGDSEEYGEDLHRASKQMYTSEEGQDYSTSIEDEMSSKKASDARFTTGNLYRTESSSFSSREYQGAPSRSTDDHKDTRSRPKLSSVHTEDKHRSKSTLKDLIDFRKDHYFETHSTEDLFKTIPEHICVHRFDLDDRLFPQPLNSDAYEASRCIICDKPMNIPPVKKLDDRVATSKNIFPKFYKYGLAPRKIHLAGDKNVKIEMLLDDWDKFKCLDLQKPNYSNTYALKYQKGVA